MRPMTSRTLWVALLWILLITTKPVSEWFGVGSYEETMEAYLEGNPLNRNIALVLIIVGFFVLLGRRLNWGTLFVSNRWVFAFFLYCGISIVWSDYAFVSLKRWVKDLGNVIAVLIIITENDPFRAVKAVLARYVSLIVPLSVLLIKYFPELGRYYNHWTWMPYYCGVTTNKNELGISLFVCGLFLVWDFMDRRIGGLKHGRKVDLLGHIVLGLMVIWMMADTRSATALACLILGVSTLLFTRLPLVKSQVKHLGAFSVAVGLMVLLLYSIPAFLEILVGVLGRNTTLTGRTDLWAALLRESVDPVLGVGYKSFWLGPAAERTWEKFAFHPIQAHNGYLEIYLNVGLVGLCLLLAIIVSGGKKLKKQLEVGSSFGGFRFSCIVVAMFYNWTEALFNQFSLVWIILLIAVLNYSPSQGNTSKNGS